jgi:hypothetical protein
MPEAANVSLESHKTRRWHTDAKSPDAHRRDVTEDTNFFEHEHREAKDTTLKNRRRSSRRRLRTLNEANTTL